ncbi:hypothetical protein CK203_056747 [Vitis vinifera]|uniref:Uncharacterized protein n=1 Tax=Vitis vinifera TaxID=29760 RepID=A0A438GKI8_VITVI|nr:hypothetical protein CK203_056747 [Vitis vinifera]
MDRAKLAIKASIKQWEKYWEVIDRRWEGQLHRHLHATAYFLNPMFNIQSISPTIPEIKVGLKEVIKRLEPDLDRQAKTINEVKLFVDGQGEFGSALTKKAINQSLPDEWIREGEEPILSSDNLDWLDKGLPTNEEGRERDVDSRRKGKTSRTISSSSSSDDGDNRGSRRGSGTSGGNRGVGGTSEVAVALLIEVLDTIKLVLIPNSLSKPYFPDYGSSSQSSHPPYLSYEPLFQSYPHYGNCHPNLYARRRTDDDDDFEPPRHSTWN